jgi:transcriptional regulator with XRE-family HTH domain
VYYGVVLLAQNELKEGDKMGISLKALRVNAELSRPEVIARLEAEKGLKLSLGTLRSYENKETQPTVTTAQTLASFYGVSVDDIIFL